MRVILIAEPGTPYASAADVLRRADVVVVPEDPANVDTCLAVVVAVPAAEIARYFRIIGPALRLGKPVYFWDPADPTERLGAGRLGPIRDKEEFGRFLAGVNKSFKGVQAGLRAGGSEFPDRDLPSLLNGISVLEALAQSFPAAQSSRQASGADYVVPFRAYDFEPADLAEQGGELRFTADQFAHALFTTGRAPADWSKHGAESFWEAIHRISIIPPYLFCNEDGHLLRTPLMKDLDPSERSAIAYALGQAATALFCRQKLKVRHLLHVSRYAAHHRVTFAVGKSRPDLFGPIPGGWVVAEAKGRGGALDARVRDAARCQKNMITSVGDIAPKLRVACLAYFPTEDGGMALEAVDPDDGTPPSDDPTISRDDFLAAYYAPFTRAIDLGEHVLGDVSIAASRLAGIGLTVQMSTALYLRVQQALGGDQNGLSRDVDLILARTRSEQLLSDGTAVLFS